MGVQSLRHFARCLLSARPTRSACRLLVTCRTKSLQRAFEGPIKTYNGVESPLRKRNQDQGIKVPGDSSNLEAVEIVFAIGILVVRL